MNDAAHEKSPPGPVPSYSEDVKEVAIKKKIMMSPRSMLPFPVTWRSSLGRYTSGTPSVCTKRAELRSPCWTRRSTVTFASQLSAGISSRYAPRPTSSTAHGMSYVNLPTYPACCFPHVSLIPRRRRQEYANVDVGNAEKYGRFASREAQKGGGVWPAFVPKPATGTVASAPSLDNIERYCNQTFLVVSEISGAV